MHARLLLAPVFSLALAACADPVTGPVGVFEPAFAPASRPFEPNGPQQPVVDLARGFTLAIYPAGEGQNLAQTFSVTSSMQLGYVELPVGCTAGTLLNVKIREGIGGAILFEGNVLGLPQVVDGDFELIQVYNPATSRGIRLRPDRTYAFELAAFPSGASHTCGLAPGPAGNSYGGGKGWYEDVPINGPGFIPLPTGNPTDDEDLPFITLVR